MIMKSHILMENSRENVTHLSSVSSEGQNRNRRSLSVNLAEGLICPTAEDGRRKTRFFLIFSIITEEQKAVLYIYLYMCSISLICWWILFYLTLFYSTLLLIFVLICSVLPFFFSTLFYCTLFYHFLFYYTQLYFRNSSLCNVILSYSIIFYTYYLTLINPILLQCIHSSLFYFVLFYYSLLYSMLFYSTGLNWQNYGFVNDCSVCEAVPTFW